MDHKAGTADEYLAEKEQVMHLVAVGDGQLYAKAMQIIDRWKQRATH